MKLQESYMLQAGKYLLSCLMGAIDRGMTAQYGPEWFEKFRAGEKDEKIPLITDEVCLEDLDLQACLKFLKFRSEYRDAVLSYFGFYDLGTEAQKKEWRNTFTQAVTRLMDNYRNKYMHLPAGSAETEWNVHIGDTVYGVAETIGDMKEVSKHFLTVRDASGVPYYDRICECETRYEEDKKRQGYCIRTEMMSRAFRGTCTDDFIRACNELNIPVQKGDRLDDSDKDEFYFYSSAKETDLQEIKKQMSRDREKNKGHRRKGALIAGLTVTGAAAAAVILIFTLAGKGDSGSVTGISAEEFKPSEFREGDIDTEEAEKLVLSMRESASDKSFDEYKQFYTKKYREDEVLDDFIESEQKWLKGVSNCEKYLFVPVVSEDNLLGVSVVFYGRSGDPGYKNARLFTFTNEDNVLKNALDKIASVSKYTGDYPEGYNSAVAEKRNTYITDDGDRSLKAESAVPDGVEMQELVLAWAEPDSSVSLLIRLSNGSQEDTEYNSVHINVMTGSDSALPNALLYDGVVDLRRNGKPFVLEAGKGVNYIVNIKRDSITEGAAACDWGRLKVTIE